MSFSPASQHLQCSNVGPGTVVIKPGSYVFLGEPLTDEQWAAQLKAMTQYIVFSGGMWTYRGPTTCLQLEFEKRD